MNYKTIYHIFNQTYGANYSTMNGKIEGELFIFGNSL